jgi:hypothetical protein
MFKIEKEYIVDMFNALKEITGYKEVGLAIVDKILTAGETRVSWYYEYKTCLMTVKDVKIYEPIIYINNSKPYLAALYNHIARDGMHGMKQRLKRIRRKTGLSKAYTILIFALLHEIGHWDDRVNERTMTNIEYVQNNVFFKLPEFVPYRQRKMESYADKYAIDMMEIMFDIEGGNADA